MYTGSVRFAEIRPFVRYANDERFPANRKISTVIAYDHQLFYVLSGSGSVTVNGTTFPLIPGNVLYWMSGTQYRLQSNPDSGLHLISVNFDFTCNNTSYVHPIPMAAPDKYRACNCLELLTFSDAVTLNHPVILAGCPELLPLLQSMTYEFQHPEVLSDFQFSNLMASVLLYLYRFSNQERGLKKHAGSYRMVLNYVQEHYAEDLTNLILAQRFNYHPNYISKLFTDQTGDSLHQYLLKTRIRHAITLLQTSNEPISEIAHSVGFKNASYFSQYFRQVTGYTPKAFRISHHTDQI